MQLSDELVIESSVYTFQYFQRMINFQTYELMVFSVVCNNCYYKQLIHITMNCSFGASIVCLVVHTCTHFICLYIIITDSIAFDIRFYRRVEWLGNKTEYVIASRTILLHRNNGYLPYFSSFPDYRRFLHVPLSLSLYA